MIPHLAIIADDLTGAMDSGLQFSNAGHHTVISISSQPDLRAAADVLVVTAHVRETDAATTYAAVRAAVHPLAAAGIRRFYHKVDSTLRGHIAAGLDAILDELGWCRALFCPSFPENGRVLAGGYHLVWQVPLQQTDLALDPGAHFRTSYVPDFLQAHTRRAVGLIPLHAVLGGPSQVRAAMAQAFAAGQEILVADAATRTDLAAIAEAAEQWPEPLLLAGAAGLAGALAARMAPVTRGSRHAAIAALSPVDRAAVRPPIFLISGSTTEVSRRQVAVLLQQSDIATVVVQGPRLIGADAASESQRVAEEALAFLRSGQDVLIVAAPDPAVVEATLAAGRALGLGVYETRHRLAAGLASIVARVAGQVPPAGLILTGGEVAYLALAALNGARVEIIGEVQAGVPGGLLVRHGLPPLPVVTKGGSLGQENALIQAVAYLRRLASGGVTP